MHTESEAKKLWCPMSRTARVAKAPWWRHLVPKKIATVWPSANRFHYADGTEHLEPCIASGCAMWRWSRERDEQLAKAGRDPSGDPMRRGYCGLAAKGD